jgi:2-oxoglutarate dehydrogenase complex dehydrogenase (E1) component-like enzyme
MGRMKDLLITIHNGGDEAVAAVERMGKDWREQLEQAASEIERLRLTDAEREAIDWAAYAAEKWYEHTAAATLRGLLERTK